MAATELKKNDPVLEICLLIPSFRLSIKLTIIVIAFNDVGSEGAIDHILASKRVVQQSGVIEFNGQRFVFLKHKECHIIEGD